MDRQLSDHRKIPAGRGGQGFSYGRKARKGNWDAQWTPLGRGMVRFPQFFEMLAGTDFGAPCSCTLNILWEERMRESAKFLLTELRFIRR